MLYWIGYKMLVECRSFPSLSFLFLGQSGPLYKCVIFLDTDADSILSDGFILILFCKPLRSSRSREWD